MASSPSDAVTLLGTEIPTGVKITVDDEKRESGMYVCGVQGTGKSSFLESLIHQDICKGYSVILIDPHGDLIEHVITQLPEERVKDTYLLNIEDAKHPFGVNLFTVPKDAGLVHLSVALSRIMHVFERVFPASSRMFLEKYLENIALVFLENPGLTMVDIPRFLTDASFRQSLTKDMKNSYVRDFWEDYSSLSPAKQREETAPLVNRLNSFLNKPLVRNIVGQKTSKLDFRLAIQQGHILLIRLPIKTLGEMAELIGTMLVALIHSATFSFENKPRSSRPGFSLYVDEFQNFSTIDFAQLFTEARKYKARQVVANQYTKQLDLEELQEAVTTAYSIVAFRTTDDDSRKLAPLFSTLDLSRGKPVIIYRDNIFKRLLSHPNSIVREWTYTFIGDLEEASKQRVRQETENVYGSSGKTIGKRTYDTLPEYNFGAGTVAYDPSTVKEILKLLDILLYETMRNKKVSEQTRLFVIRAIAPLLHFADYFTLAYANHFDGKASFDEWMAEKLQADTETKIKALAISNHEEIHIRFVKRLDAVLAILVQEPLAEETQTTQADIAKALSHLENFTAIARVGSQTYHIRPAPIPNGQVSGSELWERRRTIQKQTWDRYCRSSDEVEQEMAKKARTLAMQQKQAKEGTDDSQASPQGQRPRFEDVE